MITLAEIQAACSPELLASRDYTAIAAAVNAGRTKIVPRLIGFGRVLDTLGDDAGAAVLDAIESLRSSVPKLKYVWILLEKGELDVGMESVRTGLDQLAAGGVMSIAQVALLKSLAEVPAPVTAAECEVALKNDDGTLK